MKPSIGNENRLAVLKIVGAYIFFGTLWIYLSDTILGRIVHDLDLMTSIVIFKGVLFIVLTAILLYYLIARHDLKFKVTEEQLKESEERYRGILEDMEESYYEVDLEGRFTFFNQSIARTYGYTEDELMGTSYKTAMDKENIKKVINAFHQVYVTGETIKGVDWKLRNKNGKGVYVEASVTLRRDFQGNPIGFKGITRDITERKQAEEVLRESEGIFRVLFNQSYHLIGLMKVDGTLIKANSTALEFAGITESDVIGRPFWETSWWSHSEEQRERLRNAVTEAAHGDFVRFETHHPDAEGHLHYIDFSIKPVKDEDNNVVLLLPEGRDITERKRAEEAQRESKELYTRLVDTIPDIVVRSDLDGKILFINDYTHQISGYSREEIEGQNMLKFIAPEDQDRVIQNMQLMIENRLSPHEYLLKTKDGRKIPIEVNGDVLRNENGKPFGRVHVCRDITQRKQAEELLRQSEATYRFLTDKMNDMIWTANLDFNLTYISPSVKKILGFTPEERIRQTPSEMMTPETVSNAFNILNREFEREHKKGVDPERTVKVEMDFYHKNGSIVRMENVMSAIRDHDGTITGIHGVSRDITERKQAEEEKKKLETQLAQAQKLESIGTLARGYCS